MKRLIFVVGLAAFSAQAGAALICSNYTDGTAATWYTSYDPSVLDVVDTNGDVACYADGPELTFIRQKFPNMRNRIGSGPVYWRGDDAAFILENL